MPTGTNTNLNSFLLELLELQQDGRQAISAPTNWTQSKPLLEVRTELNSLVDELASSCLKAGGNSTGRWHFFIGSPGNGKSAAVGHLVRILIEQYGCTVTADDGTELAALPSDSVPYMLTVFEPGNRYPSVRILQDASVVRNPYASDADPARDLLETLSDSWERGLSLIVCTNRGVLEKAFRDTYLNAEVNQKIWHKAILRSLVEAGTGSVLSDRPLSVEGRQTVFSAIKPTAKFLDSRSLILGEIGIFDGLLQEATKTARWTTCENCGVARLCPFKANRDWIADAEGRKRIVEAFRRAEVLSTQVIVFREALAAISFLLAGCPEDYHSLHPCEWVQMKVEAGDIFGLATRRIYMCLFASSSPRGFEANETLRNEQHDALVVLLEACRESGCSRALGSALKSPAPSIDVGISRLLGRTGVFASLDATLGPLPASFFDQWDGAYDRIVGLNSPLASELDRECARIWSSLETDAENLPTYLSASAFWALRRWSTQFTLHFGMLLEGRATAAEYLDEFSELLGLLSIELSRQNVAVRRRLQKLEQLVESLLNRAPDEGGVAESAVAVAENVFVSGRWLEREMRPRVSTSSASGSLSIAIRFGNNGHDQTLLVAPMYLWLKERSNGKMDPRSLPSDLLAEAMDAKARAVTKSQYAFAEEDVAISVKGTRESYTLTRFREEVDVDVENTSR